VHATSWALAYELAHPDHRGRAEGRWGPGDQPMRSRCRVRASVPSSSRARPELGTTARTRRGQGTGARTAAERSVGRGVGVRAAPDGAHPGFHPASSCVRPVLVPGPARTRRNRTNSATTEGRCGQPVRQAVLGAGSRI